VILDERHDRVNELLDAAKGTTPNSFSRDFPEPAFDEIQLRATRWCEVHVKATMSCQPCLHLWVFVGRVVVNNHVDVEVLRSLPVDKPQKLIPSWCLCLGMQDAINRPSAISIAAKQRCRSMAFGVVRHRAAATRIDWQALLGAVERLNPAFFIRAEHESMFGGIEIQSNSIGQFLDELTVPVRQWVISIPKRLRCFLENRPVVISALTKIFLAEVERLLREASLPLGTNTPAGTPARTLKRPRISAVSFLHRFGSALNRQAHIHASSHRRGLFADCSGCRVFAGAARVIRRPRPTYNSASAAQLSIAMCRATSGASNTSCDPVPDRPSHAQATQASSAIEVGRISRVRYSLPRHKRGKWVGPGRKRKSSRPSENGVVDLSPFEFLGPARRSHPATAQASTAAILNSAQRGGRGLCASLVLPTVPRAPPGGPVASFLKSP